MQLSLWQCIMQQTIQILLPGSKVLLQRILKSIGVALEQGSEWTEAGKLLKSMIKSTFFWTIINQDFEGTDSDGSKSEEHFISKESKGDSCRVPAESLEKFSSAVMWKLGHISMNLVIYLVKSWNKVP